jgi:superfamily I DNA and/or RNA helicase
MEALSSSLDARVEAGTTAFFDKQRRAAVERAILRSADVVLATTVGAGADNVQTLPVFDLGVLDEAAQATEPAAWIPLVRCRRVMLVGDPCQLPPLVRSNPALAGGLATPLMARVAQPQQRAAAAAAAAASSAAGSTPSVTASLSSGVLGCLLTTQYRSHASISDWASREMYGGQLVAAPAVAAHTLAQLPGVRATPATSNPLLMLDTRTAGGRGGTAGGLLLAGCSEESESALNQRTNDHDVGGGGGGGNGGGGGSSSSSSLVNDGEAHAVMMHVTGLLGAGVRPADIAVLSPYAAQVRLIRARLAAAAAAGDAPGANLVEVASVDAFQGREAEAVVLSLVRRARSYPPRHTLRFKSRNGGSTCVG